ncbi:MAG: tetratricopeptide repeat protein [Thermodesulfobacteriota bacterium]
MAFFLLASLAYGGAAFKRNPVWDNEVTLGEDIIAKAPQKPKSRFNLGNAYYIAKRLPDAIKEFEAAVYLNPFYSEAHYNLGIAYGDNGQSDLAYRHMQEGMRLSELLQSTPYAPAKTPQPR